jgi:hypothetical protein
MHGDDLPHDDDEDAHAVQEDDAHAIEEEDDQGDVSKLDEEYTGVDAVEVVVGVEELRVELVNCASPAHCRYTCPWPPFASLRALEITGYLVEPDARGRLAFPCLEAMRLMRCRLEIATLQDMIDAAPRLADLWLEAVCFEDDQYEYHLCCPTATAIVIADLHGFGPSLNFRGCSVTLDAPHVRHFRYANVVTFEDTNFSIEQQPPYLEQVHLAVHSSSTQAAQLRRSLLASVRHVRSLKLTAYSMADLADVMWYYYYNLERLEIEELCGWCIRDDSGTAASALVKLLRKCPGIRELRIKFSWREYLEETTDPEVLNAAMSDFAPCRAIVNEEEDCCHGLDHHKLCYGFKVDCLQDSLRRVVVEFDMEELTCFQLRLVKFLAKNAMALEELVVDGGEGYDRSHIDCKIARWMKRRRRASSALPAMNPNPRWPPPLSEFPPLARDPDPEPMPATTCSEATISSVALWRPVRLADLYGEFTPSHRRSLPFPRRLPARCPRPQAASRPRSAALPAHPCKNRKNM